MKVVLYQPAIQPQLLPSTGFSLDAGSGAIIQNHTRAEELLGYAPELVDVLASGQGYLIYSVFDHEGEANTGVMEVLSTLTGNVLDEGDEDEVLRGPVLVVQN